MQGMELSDQRGRMASQANALEVQTRHIERLLLREDEDRCWRDILELLEAFREMVPVARDGDVQTAKDDDYVRFVFAAGSAQFRYVPAGQGNLDSLNTTLFLGRAAGGIGQALFGLMFALKRGSPIQCPKGQVRFERMAEILAAVDRMAPNLSRPRRLILEGCRLPLWRKHLQLVRDAYARNKG